MERTDTVVVIEDDREVRKLVELAIASPARVVVGFDRGDEALRFIDSSAALALVISDIAMEGYDGHHLLRHLRSADRTASTPVIFLAPSDEPPPGIGGISDAGVTVLETPFDVDELRRAANSAIARPRASMTRRDRITGLLDARGFAEALRLVSESKKPVALVLTACAISGEVDRDAILRRIASIVAAQLRGTDAAARLDADRFATLHFGCDGVGGALVAERIAAAMAADEACARARVSHGVAATDEGTGDGTALLARAERALERHSAC